MPSGNAFPGQRFFDEVYTGPAPWDIGAPQRDLVRLIEEQLRGNARCRYSLVAPSFYRRRQLVGGIVGCSHGIVRNRVHFEQIRLQGKAMGQLNAISNPEVVAVFDEYPPSIRQRLMQLRQLILDTAAEIDGVGKIEEALRWGEPAYITSESKSGTTIRIDRRRSSDTQYAMYFHCGTNLVDRFRTVFPDEFEYEGNRAIIFDEEDRVPVEALKTCIAWALTYHSDKRPERGRGERRRIPARRQS